MDKLKKTFNGLPLSLRRLLLRVLKKNRIYHLLAKSNLTSQENVNLSVKNLDDIFFEFLDYSNNWDTNNSFKSDMIWSLTINHIIDGQSVEEWAANLRHYYTNVCGVEYAEYSNVIKEFCEDKNIYKYILNDDIKKFKEKNEF